MTAGRNELPEGLLKDVKNHLDITWDDEPTDKKIAGLIAAGMALYAGAKLIADAVHEEIQNLRVSSVSYATPGNPSNAVSRVQQQGLLDGLGIAPIQEDKGYLHVKVGFDGYNGLVTRAHPKGQPNAEVARSLESGTSYMIKQPFVTAAVRKSRKEAEKAMAEVIDQEIEKATKG